MSRTRAQDIIDIHNYKSSGDIDLKLRLDAFLGREILEALGYREVHLFYKLTMKHFKTLKLIVYLSISM